jgi:hypothetical protein
MPVAVYIATSDDHPAEAAQDRVQVGTALEMAVHRTGGGGATQLPPLALQVANFVLN